MLRSASPVRFQRQGIATNRELPRSHPFYLNLLPWFDDA